MVFAQTKDTARGAYLSVLALSSRFDGRVSAAVLMSVIVTFSTRSVESF